MLEHVLRSGTIGELRLPHRIITGAMHLGLETSSDAAEALAAFYVERVRGGAGLIVTGGSAISEVGAGGRNYSFVNSPADTEKLRHVATAVHEAGGLIALQLFHAGRYAFRESFGLRPVAPSPVYSRFSRCEPAPLTDAQIRDTIEDFGRGAEQARELGYDAVEVMGSEGYLVDQFLSPLTNRRTDAWGGDSDRRIRFGVEVLRAVRRAVGGDYPVIFRLSGTDLLDGGTTEDDVLAFAVALASGGADALNVGIGWHESPVPTVQAIVPPGAWTGVAAKVKAAVGDLPVIAGNRINRLAMAESILADGTVDFVSMSRPFLADPALIAKALRGGRVNLCIACNQACIDRSLTDAHVSCMVNPVAGREREYPPVRTAAPRRFAVVGGGPAGLQAAKTLALLGHAVDLYESADALGGQFRLACRVPGKEDYAQTVAYFAAELARLGVAVHLSRLIGPEDIDLLRRYDGVVVASGVHPRPVDIPGAELPHVLAYPDAFGTPTAGARVAIVGGGGIGVDVAHLLSHGSSDLGPVERFRREQGIDTGTVPVDGRRSVTILQRGTRVGAGIGVSTRWAVLAQLRRQGVRVESGVTYQRIEPAGVQITDADGTTRLTPADTVVIAAGQESDIAVPALATRAGVPHRLVGGARDVAGLDAVRAFAEGLAAATELAAEVCQPIGR